LGPVASDFSLIRSFCFGFAKVSFELRLSCGDVPICVPTKAFAPKKFE
jgi:hypothetical protein